MDGNKVRLSWKEQTEAGTPATGAGAFALDVVPGNGLAPSAQQIKSRLQRRSRMMLKSKPGSRFAQAAYETELRTSLAIDQVVRNVLGSAAGADVDTTEATMTQLTITGGGTILTFTGGSLLTLGARFGSVITLSGMSVAANNGVPTPVLTVSANGRIITVPPGYLLDNPADVAFGVKIHKQYFTPDAGYTDRYFTSEQYYPDLEDGDGNSKVAEWCRFNQLSFGVNANNYASLGFGYVGRDILAFEGSDTPPIHTDPTYGIEQDVGLDLLDGALWVDGVREINFESLSLTLNAQAGVKPVAGSRVSPSVSLGSFELAGQIVRIMEDIAQYQKYDERAQVRFLAMFNVPDNPTKFVSVAAGDLCFGGHTDQIGNQDDVSETIPLWGGEDPSGTGYAKTALLVATSTADDA